MKKVSIVMTYYNRQTQLLKTLESFKKYDPKDFNVVIVDDGSDSPPALLKYPFDIKLIHVKNKKWILGTPAWNIGIRQALQSNPDVIILQNAECYHAGDILSVAKFVDDNIYLTFGCYSQGKDEEVGSVINNRKASFDGESAWYNHSLYNPRALHFCSAITARNMAKLNGFDERFSYGTGYDDDYFLHQVACLGLKVCIADNPYVIHQWHYNHTTRPDFNELSLKNRNLFNEMAVKKEFRAEHIFTEDLTEVRISNNYAYSTHQPLLTLLSEVFKPPFVLELGMGYYSTTLIQKMPCEKMHIENDKAWISEMNVKGNVMHHEITVPNQDIPVHDISPGQKADIEKYYTALRKEIKSNKYNLLFVDNYSCCRAIAINTLYPEFDLIVYHDCEPQAIYRNNYYFDLGLINDFDHYTLITPRTWAGCFIRKSINDNNDQLFERIKPIIAEYKRYNSPEWMFLKEGFIQG